MDAKDIPDWAKKRAAGLATSEALCVSQWTAAEIDAYPFMRAFARYIAQHEQPPVDPDLIEAREVAAAVYERLWAAPDDDGHSDRYAQFTRDGAYDDGEKVQTALAAIKRGKELANGGAA